MFDVLVNGVVLHSADKKNEAEGIARGVVASTVSDSHKNSLKRRGLVGVGIISQIDDEIRVKSTASGNRTTFRHTNSPFTVIVSKRK